MVSTKALKHLLDNNEILQNVSFQDVQVDEDGNEMVGVVVSISKTEVEMDFNHPLAELDLHFIGSICDVREEA